MKKHDKYPQNDKHYDILSTINEINNDPKQYLFHKIQEIENTLDKIRKEKI